MARAENKISCCFLAARTPTLTSYSSPVSWSRSRFAGGDPRLAPRCCTCCFTPKVSFPLSSTLKPLAHPSGIIQNVSFSGDFSDSRRHSWELQDGATPPQPYQFLRTACASVSAILGKRPRVESRFSSDFSYCFKRQRWTLSVPSNPHWLSPVLSA